MKFDQEFIVAAHEHTNHNRQAIENSTRVGCFFCARNYDAAEIDPESDDWIHFTDEHDIQGTGQTALCAYCGIDSVLPDASGLPIDDPEFLKAMRAHWFAPMKFKDS